MAITLRRCRLPIAAAVAVVTFVGMPLQSAFAQPYDYTNPSSDGCANTASNHWAQPLNDNYGYNLATLTLRYSSSCRTIWSKLYAFQSDSAEITTYPWVVREHPPYPAGNTWGQYSICDWGTVYNDTNYSLQLDDAGYLGHAWGAFISAPATECEWGSIIDDTAVGPY